MLIQIGFYTIAIALFFLVVYCRFLRIKLDMASHKSDSAYTQCADLYKKYHNLVEYLNVTEVNKLEKKDAK